MPHFWPMRCERVPAGGDLGREIFSFIKRCRSNPVSSVPDVFTVKLVVETAKGQA